MADLIGGLFGAPAFDNLPSMRGFGFGDKEGGARSGAGPGPGPRSGAKSGPTVGGRRGRQSRAIVEKVFSCSLRELCEGCEKKLRATDTVIDPMTGHPRTVSHVYRIEVKPGWKDGTRVTFPPTAEGLRSICFVMHEKPHKYLRREGDSLVYICGITEQQAQRGVRIRVPLPSKGDPPVDISTRGRHVRDGDEMVLPDLGMPVKGGPKRGPFKIQFRVQSTKAHA
ncbi:unnamed protein product [Choristocarpus tenellus]